MSTWTYRQSDGKAASKIVPPRLRIPCWKGLGADSEEKREPASDIDTAAVDSLKVLDPERPIREAEVKSVHSRPLNYPVATPKFWQARRRQCAMGASPEPVRYRLFTA